MSDVQGSRENGQEGEERAEPRTTTGKKPRRKRGRPKGSKSKVLDARTGTSRDSTSATPATGERDLAAVKRERRLQERVIARQRKDCDKLGATVQAALDAGQADPKDIRALSAALKTLHDLERQCYDFGQTGAQVKAVIVLPAGPDTMEAWNKLSGGLLGQDSRPAMRVTAKPVEDDVLGSPTDPDGDESEPA